MANATRDAPDEEGVEFIHEDGGTITAKDPETGVASHGDTKVEALRMLADALTLHAGGGEPSDDEEAFLEEIDVDPDEIDATSEQLWE